MNLFEIYCKYNKKKKRKKEKKKPTLMYILVKFYLKHKEKN